MNEKPDFFQRCSRFLSGKGFYMVLLLCLVTVAASGIFLYRTVSDSLSGEAVNANVKVTVPDTPAKPEPASPPREEAADTAEPEEPAAETQAPAKPEPAEVPVEEPPAEASEPTVAQAEPAQAVDAPAEEVKKVSFSWPLEGEVVAAFSETELSYNELLGDWRTHDAMDIAAPMGTDVCAAADGAVFSIDDDPFTGTTLTLIHADGLKTVYGNLNPDTLNFAQGDGVSAGAALACLGGGSGTEPYLHFAVLLNDQPVNPSDYLSE